jgi:ferredoxin, 2Fe-2S
MPRLTITLREGEELALAPAPGESLMQVARAAGLPVIGECNGSMACATCHVIVDPAWADRLDPPAEAEEAVLDTLFNLETTSRLGCQIRMSAALDGLRVRLPPD